MKVMGPSACGMFAASDQVASRIKAGAKPVGILSDELRVSYNYGISVLKILSCFMIVALHFGRGDRFLNVSVPIFMIIALYLSGKSIENGGLLRRLIRLYVPFAAWGIFYFVAFSLVNQRLNVLALVEQLVIGVPVCPPLYFISLLMAATLIMRAIRMASRRRHWESLLLVLAISISFAMQYSGANTAIFDRLAFAPRMALGRFFELLPAAVAGYALWLIRGRRDLYLVIGALMAFSILIVNISHCNLGTLGYCYQGIPLFATSVLYVSVAIYTGLWWQVSEQSVLARIIKTIAGLTAGIYYIHLFVGKVMELAFGRNRGWVTAITVFGASALCVAMIKRIRWLSWLVR